MTKEEILIDLINKILVDKYELHEVKRSNSNELQEYNFVIKKVSDEGDPTR